MFFDELEILDLRLNYLNPFVDRFVLVESTKTHSLKDKPLFFEENKSLFSEFLPKIEHVIVDDLESTDPWVNETRQRNAIMKGLVKCSGEDIIICSDCDEIPRIESIFEFKDQGLFMGFVQTMYNYYFNVLTDTEWCGSKICRYKSMTETSPNDFRWTCLENRLAIYNGGWHFSFLGSPERIAKKIQSFSHVEKDIPEYTDLEKIQQRIDTATDPFSRPISLKCVPLDSSFPSYLLENRDKFKHLIKDIS
jgi:beta-1,4-mannosyl-glycoprotein beta-1,4-N-acetylglucosaminyltransferase